MKLNVLKARGAPDSRVNDFLYLYDEQPGSRSLIATNVAVLKLATCMLLGAALLFHNVAFADKCLYVSSYHNGYEWNDGIERGIETALSGKCELDKYYMDTKRNKGEAFYKKSALATKEYIEANKPDIVIACDDNASKYLIKPYFKDGSLPFVFCGINWTSEPYGYPYKNVTGIIEVAPIRPLLKEINGVVEPVKKGVYLSADVLTEHKDYQRYRDIYIKEGVELRGVFVKTMADWKKEFIAAQSDGVDFIVLNNNSGINDWNDEEGKQTVLEHSQVFSVTNYDWMMPYSMFAMTKLPEEQGEWAAQVALTILDGKQPSNIPIVVNRRWNIFVNPALLEKSGIKLPSHIMHKAIKTGP